MRILLHVTTTVLLNNLASGVLYRSHVPSQGKSSLRQKRGKCHSPEMERVLLHDAAAKQGAVCLDGSPPVYYIRKGYGGGAHKWVIFYGGGGWCLHDSCMQGDEACLARAQEKAGLDTCEARAHTEFGSSHPSAEENANQWALSTSKDAFPEKLQAVGDSCLPEVKQGPLDFKEWLSTDPAVNPLHDWNVAYLWYCDGSSWTSDAPEPVRVGPNGQDQLFYRGHRINMAMMEDLMTRQGLGQASHLIVSGFSAGGVATLLHVDKWADRLRKEAATRGLQPPLVFGFARGPVFVPDVLVPVENATANLRTGNVAHAASLTAEDVRTDIYTRMHCAAGVPEQCLAAKRAAGSDERSCILAVEAAKYVSTPTWIVRSVYDQWELINVAGILTDLKHPSVESERQANTFGRWVEGELHAITTMNTHINVRVHSCLCHSCSCSCDGRRLWDSEYKAVLAAGSAEGIGNISQMSLTRAPKSYPGGFCS